MANISHPEHINYRLPHKYAQECAFCIWFCQKKTYRSFYKRLDARFHFKGNLRSSFDMKNVRHVYHDNCIKWGKSKTKLFRMGLVINKRTGKQDLEVQSKKPVHRHNMLQYQHHITANRYFTKVINMAFAAGLHRQFCLRFRDLPQQAIHAVNLV